MKVGSATYTVLKVPEAVASPRDAPLHCEETELLWRSEGGGNVWVDALQPPEGSRGGATPSACSHHCKETDLLWRSDGGGNVWINVLQPPEGSRHGGVPSACSPSLQGDRLILTFG